MTGETGPHIDDFEARANALDEQYRMESGDPVSLELLDNLAGVREWLRAESTAKVVTVQDIEASVNELNTVLRNMRLYRERVRVTGRLRLNWLPDQLDYDKIAEYEEMAKFHGLGPLREDERGPYFEVYDRLFVCDEFHSFVPESGVLADTRIELNVVIDPDDDDADTPLCIDTEDILALNPVEHSVERITRDLEQFFPEILAILQKLPTPDDGLSEDERRHVLEDFVLDIDWAQYKLHHSVDDLERLPDLISDYITARLGYDGGEYSFFVKGLIMGSVDTAEGPRPVFRIIKKPMEIFGSIGPIRLHEIAGDPSLSETTKRYQLKFTAMCRIKGGGAQYVEIPVASLGGITNMSNDLLFTNALVEPEDDAFELLISPEVAVYEGPGELIEDEPVEAAEADQVEELDLKTEDGVVHFDADSYLARALELGQEANDAIGRVLSKFDLFRSKVYENYDEAIEDMYGAQEYAVEELGPYIGSPLVFEVRGEDLRIVPIDIKIKETPQSLTIEANAHDMQQGDSLGLTVCRGYLESCDLSITAVGSDDDEAGERYCIVAELSFNDAENSTTYSIATTDKASYMDIPVQPKFRAHISENTQISLPRYDQLAVLTKTLEKLEEEYPDYEDLVPRLAELQAVVDAQANTPGKAAINVGHIHELFELATGNTALRESITRAVAHILDGKTIHIVADYFNEQGEREYAKTIHGDVLGVLTPLQGPAADMDVIWIELTTGGLVQAPVASVRKMEL